MHYKNADVFNLYATNYLCLWKVQERTQSSWGGRKYSNDVQLLLPYYFKCEPFLSRTFFKCKNGAKMPSVEALCLRASAHCSAPRPPSEISQSRIATPHGSNRTQAQMAVGLGQVCKGGEQKSATLVSVPPHRWPPHCLSLDLP